LSVTPAKEVPTILCERDKPITLAVASKASGIQLKHMAITGYKDKEGCDCESHPSQVILPLSIP